MASENMDVNEVIRHLQAQTKMDYLKLGSNKELIKFLDQKSRGQNVETVLFSDSVLKVNKRGKQQNRELVITTQSVFNFTPHHYKSCKREISLARLKGLILSSVNDEMLIQVRNDYDYRLLVVRKADLVSCLSSQYQSLVGSSLPVAFSDDLDKSQVRKEDLKRLKKKRNSVSSAAHSEDERDDLPHPRSNHKEPGSSGPPTPLMGGGRGVDGMSGSAGPRESMASSIIRENAHVGGGGGGGGGPRGGGGGGSGWGADEDEDAEGREQLNVSLEGWLTKKGISNTMWRRRYFRLSDTNLLYYEARMKGQLLIDGGQCRYWKNKRVSIDASEADLPQSPHHLRNILRDSERAKAFLRFVQSLHSPEDTLFYLEVEDYRKLSDGTPEQEKAAQRLLDVYIKPGAEQEISAPQIVKEELKDTWDHTHAHTSSMFDVVQQLCLDNMKVSVFPAYLEHSKKKMLESKEDFKLKEQLSEEDKLVPNCLSCLQSFGVMKRRYFCRFCGDVFCSTCLEKSSVLPPQYNITEPVRVCDMCHGVLEFNNQSHCFTYASKNRRPMNLAAADAPTMKEWVNALRAIIAKKEHVVYDNEEKEDEHIKPDEEGHKEGWLMKEDPTTKSWRRRYFVLDKDRLFYYVLSLKGTVSLVQGAGVHSLPQSDATLSQSSSTFGGLRSESQFAFRFNISHQDRLYALAADTEELREKWIEEIAKTIRKAVPESKSKVLSEQYMASAAQPAPMDDVTFVFTDVQNSTKLWEAVPTAMNEALEAHDALLRMLLKQFRGYEVKTEGDAFMVSFFDPLDAIRWCIAVQRGLMMDIVWPEELLKQDAACTKLGKDKKPIFNGIRIRMGIHYGKPSCRRNPVTGRMDYFGPVVNRSARVTDAAHGGQIICTEDVYEKLVQGQKSGAFTKLVDCQELGTYPFKGISEPVKVYEISPVELLERRPFPPLRISAKAAAAAGSAGPSQTVIGSPRSSDTTVGGIGIAVGIGGVGSPLSSPTASVAPTPRFTLSDFSADTLLDPTPHASSSSSSSASDGSSSDSTSPATTTTDTTNTSSSSSLITTDTSLLPADQNSSSSSLLPSDLDPLSPTSSALRASIASLTQASGSTPDEVAAKEAQIDELRKDLESHLREKIEKEVRARIMNELLTERGLTPADLPPSSPLLADYSIASLSSSSSSSSSFSDSASVSLSASTSLADTPVLDSSDTELVPSFPPEHSHDTASSSSNSDDPAILPSSPESYSDIPIHSGDGGGGHGSEEGGDLVYSARSSLDTTTSSSSSNSSHPPLSVVTAEDPPTASDTHRTHNPVVPDTTSTLTLAPHLKSNDTTSSPQVSPRASPRGSPTKVRKDPVLAPSVASPSALSAKARPKSPRVQPPPAHSAAASPTAQRLHAPGDTTTTTTTNAVSKKSPTPSPVKQRATPASTPSTPTVTSVPPNNRPSSPTGSRLSNVAPSTAVRTSNATASIVSSPSSAVRKSGATSPTPNNLTALVTTKPPGARISNASPSSPTPTKSATAPKPFAAVPSTPPTATATNGTNGHAPPATVKPAAKVGVVTTGNAQAAAPVAKPTAHATALKAGSASAPASSILKPNKPATEQKT